MTNHAGLAEDLLHTTDQLAQFAKMMVLLDEAKFYLKLENEFLWALPIPEFK